MMSRDVESTTLFDLARKVAEAVVSTLSKPGFDLKLVIEPQPAERITVRSHEATLLALLLNELISNAILHGFAGRDSGKIRIRAWLTNPKGRGMGRGRRAEVANKAQHRAYDGGGRPARGVQHPPGPAGHRHRSPHRLQAPLSRRAGDHVVASG
jgi:two-component sensor histidine kinase